MNYQEAYYRLFNAVSDCILLLQQAQQDTEEMACRLEEPKMTLLPAVKFKNILKKMNKFK